MEKEAKEVKEKKKKVSNEEVEKLKEELLKSEEKAMRIQAEMINFKRRKEEETSNFLKYANENVFLELIEIVDNFERAIKMDEGALSDEVGRFLSGFKMIYTNLVNILNKFEVKEIKAEGVEFDPNLHQAVLMEKDENKPKGVVLEVLQKGYMYKDKVLRCAMVKVNE